MQHAPRFRPGDSAPGNGPSPRLGSLDRRRPGPRRQAAASSRLRRGWQAAGLRTARGVRGLGGEEEGHCRAAPVQPTSCCRIHTCCVAGGRACACSANQARAGRSHPLASQKGRLHHCEPLLSLERSRGGKDGGQVAPLVRPLDAPHASEEVRERGLQLSQADAAHGRGADGSR